MLNNDERTEMNIYDDVIDLRDLSEDHEETIRTFMEVACDFPELSVLVTDEDHEWLLRRFFSSEEFNAAIREAGITYDEIERSLWCIEIEGQLGSPIAETAENEPTMIADRYFEQYARDLAEDLGCIPNGYEWPASHIDWEAAADALKMDYSEITMAGQTFWLRAW